MYSLAAVILLTPSIVNAVNNGLARTPQMGWNNWNSLGCDVSESLLLDTAMNVVQLGLKDLGYNYVVLDDCWSGGRDAQGKLYAEPKKFPNGMKHVADAIHSHGLKFGMYSSAGELTCARYEGSLDHEVDDANSFAEWEVDYLKYDNCYAMGRSGAALTSFERYNAMAKALNATGRPILYSLCNWGEDFVNAWGVSIANSWRVSGDIYDSFSRPDDLCSCSEVDSSAPFCVAPGSHCSIVTILNRVAPYVDRGQPGGWQDLDMLEVGGGGMSDEQEKAHFGLWAALKSPLLIGADIRDIRPSSLSILNNPAIIALNQDPLGRPAARISRYLGRPKDRHNVGESQIWSGPLYGGDQLVIMLNVAREFTRMASPIEDIFAHQGAHCSGGHCDDTWDVYDLWDTSTRMTEKDAERIIKAAKSSKNTEETAETIEAIYKELNWYNATEKPYAQGLMEGDPRLMGKKISTLQPKGLLVISVPAYAAKVLRLRSHSGGEGRKSYLTQQRDEL